MAYRHLSGYSLDSIFRWIDFVLLTLFFLICTGKKGFAFPEIASIQLWEGGIFTLLILFWKCIFSFMHMERSSTLYEAWKDIVIRTCVAVTLGWAITLLSIYLVNVTILLFGLSEIERSLFYFNTIQSSFSWLAILLLLFLSFRIIIALLLRKRYIQQPTANALIVGLNVRSLALAENLRRQESGYNLLGFADTIAEEDAQLYAKALNLVCSLEEVEEYIEAHHVDEVFLTLPVRSFYDELKNIIQYSLAMGLTVRVLNDLFTFKRGTFHYIDGDLSYFTADSPLPGKEEELQTSIKFLAEKIIAFCALFFLLPFFLAIWGLNFFHCPFSLKEYIGRNKRIFKMVQFNNMRTIPFLQKKGIRNIPRLINILLGDMSIIGPKPVPQGIQKTGAYNTLDQRRFVVKPGLIPPHSIRKENATPQQDDIQVELDYIASQGFLTDCKVLINFIKNS